MKAAVKLLVIPVCAALLAALPCRAAGAAAQAPNVIVIVVDCLRADHLSLYGYGRKTSPNIDAFASGAAVFRQAIAQAPTTLLSFASIFTSLEVSAHGVTDQTRALGDSALTMAEIFRIYGYRTGAFVGGLNLNPLFGLDRGFDKYLYVGRTDASFKDTLSPALAWAEERKAKGEKFLLVAHGNDLHTPYLFPASGLYDKGFRVSEGLAKLLDSEAQLFLLHGRKLTLSSGGGDIALTQDDADHLLARYDEGINYADALIGDFLVKLRAGGLLDGAVVVITADHGEGLFDHDYFFHDFNVYDDTLRVPLVIKVPGAAHSKVSKQVRLIDLMPTLLDLAGIPPNAAAQGESLKPLLNGDGPAPGGGRAFSESSVGDKVLRSGRWKLIRTPLRTELYDLKKDPGEKHDLYAAEKKTAAALSEDLSARLAADAELSPGVVPPAGGKFAEEMKRDAAWQKELYKRMREPGAH
ncbi:MAG: sulfatase [Elusimicrobia bacterium]|nr:sulfatase [Elusimicrobiota bacterium]